MHIYTYKSTHPAIYNLYNYKTIKDIIKRHHVQFNNILFFNKS